VATPEVIAAALEEMVAAADPHDILVFSFAGHGVKGDDDRYYLAPFGYRIDDPRGSGLSWTQLSSILGRAKARVVVILDACHSGLSGAEGLGTNEGPAGQLRGPQMGRRRLHTRPRGSAQDQLAERRSQRLEAGVVTKTACGERTLGETVRRDIQVAPAMATGSSR